MVNLSGLRPGETLLDPFCGTGIILAEAGSVGGRIYGMDFSEEMVKGAARNLENLGLPRSGMVRADAMRTSQVYRTTFDHIVTDPPYGRASASMMGPDQLIGAIPGALAHVLSPGGTLCFASPSTMDLSPQISEAGLEVEYFAYQRVHGSLGRHLYLARMA
jgi:tRNA (guanine10-N2)-dimethyltransferase